jgi:hypothetical protein
MSIDVDANGTGQGGLLRHGLLTGCRTYYILQDPPRS